MIRLPMMFVWLFISAFAFYVLGRAPNEQERAGRRLIGIGSLLVAGVLAMPDYDGKLTVGDIICVLAAALAAALLVVGLIMAYPQEWRRQPSETTHTAAD